MVEAKSNYYFVSAATDCSRKENAVYPSLDPNRNNEDLKLSLRNAGFYFKASASRARLKKLQERSARGIPSYDQYKTRQLRSFCFHRGIVVNDPSPRARSKLIKRLERSDIQPRFDFRYFAKLPAEIRELVYLEYIATLGSLKSSLPPTAPALCFASKQLRREALPIFYQSCTIEIEIPVYQYGVHRVSEGLVTGLYGLTYNIYGLAAYVDGMPASAEERSSIRMPEPLRLRQPTREFLTKAPLFMLSNVRTFELHGVVYTGEHCVDTKWTLSVCNGRIHLSEGTVTNTGKEPEEFRPACTRLEERMRKRLVECTRFDPVESIEIKNGTASKHGELSQFRAHRHQGTDVLCCIRH